MEDTTLTRKVLGVELKCVHLLTAVMATASSYRAAKMRVSLLDRP